MASYEEVVLEDAPEIFLRLAEPSGTDAADATRFGRDFTHNNTPTLDVTGPIQDGETSKAVTYTASNSEHTTLTGTAGDAKFVQGYPFTMEYWAKAPSSTSSETDYARYIFADNSVGDEQIGLVLRSDGTSDLNVRIVLFGTGGGFQPIDFRVPNALKGEWIYVVCVFRSTTDREVYANGVSIGQDSTSSSPSIADMDRLSLGGSQDSTPFYADGSVAEPAWYNYELSAERARIHHAVGRGFTDTDSFGYGAMIEGPAIYATLGDASGNAVDSSGWKRDLTVAGAPTRGVTSPLSEDGGDDATTFDGSDDAFALAGDDLDITAYPLTIEMFGKTPAGPGNSTSYARLMFGDDGTQANYFGLDIRTDGSGNPQVRGLLATGGTTDFTTGTPLLNADQFYHAVWRLVSATERHLQVNGVVVDSDTDSRSFGSGINDLVVGRDLNGSPTFYAGTMGQVLVYGRDIGEAAAIDHYAKAKQYLGTDFRTKTLAKCPSLYWRQGESAGPTGTDETEFGRDGTYAGTVTFEQTGALVDDADTAALYDGTDGQLTYSEAFITQYPVTLEALVKLPTTPSSSTSYIRVGITDASGTHKMVAGLKTDSNTKLRAFAEEIGSGTGTINNDCGGAVDGYHHLIVEFISDTSRKVWLNGVELEEETTSVSITFANLDTICVGVEDLGTDAWYEGFCDEFIIYQRQLSTAEKRDQYVAGLGYFQNAIFGTDDDGYIQAALEDAPTLLWPQNETSGTDALSSDRWGRDGTYANGFTLDQSGPNANLKSVNYDGTDGEAAYNDADDMPVKGYPFAIEAWLQSPVTLANSTEYVFFGLADSATTDDQFGVQLVTDGSGNVFARGNVREGGTDDHIDQNSGTGLSVQNNKFLHVVLVCRDATDRELYVQGRSAGTDSTSITFPTTLDTVAAGKLPTSSPSFFEGFVAMGKFFDHEPTESEILKRFLAGRTIFEADNPYLYEMGQLVPAIHYRLNEASGEPADLLGLRDLTKAGAPTQSDSGGPLLNVTDDGQITFDGSDDAAARADDAQVTAYPTAYVGWLRTPVSPGINSIFSVAGMGDDGTGSNVLAVALETDGSSNVTPSGFLTTGGTADNAQPTSPVIEENVSHHIIWVQRSATDRELYCNGASVATDATSRTFPSNLDDIILGRNAAASPTFYAGGVAEFSVLTSDVSDSEALDLYIAAFKARGIIPLGEVSVVGRIDALVQMNFPKGLSFATLGFNSGGIGIRVEMAGSITKDFRNVQSLRGAIGIIAELDGVVSAQFTQEREGRIDIVAEFNSPVTFEKMKTGQIDAIVDLVGSKTEGSTPVTDQDIGEAIIFRAPKIDYVFRANKHPTGRKL